MKLRISLLQMDIAAGDPDRNFTHLSLMLEQSVAGDVKPDIILFPEMWNTGYALEHIDQIADWNGSRTTSMISAFCKEHQVVIVAGSIAENTAEGVRNTLLAFNREGESVGSYSKIHLFRLMEEEKYLIPGNQLGRLKLEGMEAGVMICYDIRFPELARKLALDGVKLLMVPAEWPNPRLHHWRTLLQARAIENQMYVVACNRVGESLGTSFFGHSMIIDPWGEVLAEGDEKEAIITASIDLTLVDEVRGRIRVFEDRRPEHY